MSVLEEQKSKENLRARFPESRKPYTSHYDYEDDSDLEGGDDDDDDDISDDEPIVSPQVATEKPPANSLELVAILRHHVRLGSRLVVLGTSRCEG